MTQRQKQRLKKKLMNCLNPNKNTIFLKKIKFIIYFVSYYFISL